MKLKALFIVSMALLALVLADDGKAEEQKVNKFTRAKRRKIRRKLVSESDEETGSSAEAGKTEDELEDDRFARGFLDQYYQQFDQRVEPALESSDSVASVKLPDSSYLEELASTFESPVKHPSNLAAAATAASLPASPYLSPVSLPDISDTTGSPDPGQYKRAFQKESSYSTSLPGYSLPASTSNSYSSGSSSSGYSSSSSSSGYLDESDYKDSTKELASKYFGVATTTSHDIQLGLTFTVPFLSIPLDSLTGFFDGTSTSGLSDLFNMSSTNFITVAVIALGAIFLIPQVIYWLTGVNLSAFNWGRSDDPTYLTDLANTVDVALRRYDIDARQCAAFSMCKQLKAKNKSSSAEDSSMMNMLGYGIIKSASKTETFQKILGRDRVKEVFKIAESKYECEDVYEKQSCPWDEKTSKKIIGKLIMESDLDFSTLASMAIQGAKAFS